MFKLIDKGRLHSYKKDEKASLDVPVTTPWFPEALENSVVEADAEIGNHAIIGGLAVFNVSGIVNGEENVKLLATGGTATTVKAEGAAEDFAAAALVDELFGDVIIEKVGVIAEGFCAASLVLLDGITEVVGTVVIVKVNWIAGAVGAVALVKVDKIDVAVDLVIVKEG